MTPFNKDLLVIRVWGPLMFLAVLIGGLYIAATTPNFESSPSACYASNGVCYDYTEDK